MLAAIQHIWEKVLGIELGKIKGWGGLEDEKEGQPLAHACVHTYEYGYVYISRRIHASFYVLYIRSGMMTSMATFAHSGSDLSNKNKCFVFSSSRAQTLAGQLKYSSS